MSIDVTRYRIILCFVVTFCWLVFFLSSENRVQLFSDFGFFFLLGILGAVVANSTGAGGGIIFIPSFTALGLAGNEALGTSILIQCFGLLLLLIFSESWMIFCYS